MKSRIRMQARFDYARKIWNHSEYFWIFSDSYHDRRIAVDELHFTGIKLEKLGVSKTKIDAVKESNNLDQSSWWGRD